MAISIQDNNNATVLTKLRTVRDCVVGQAMTKTATNALVSASNATTMDCSLGDDWTYGGAETTTITATNVQPGQLVTILFTGTGGAVTITFGTGMHSTGTLSVGTDNTKYFLVAFTGNASGSALWEISRTTALAPA